jgi:hypothetical protein
VTIGNEMQEVAERRLHAGETFEGYCLHAIGAAAADAAAEAMAEYLGEYETDPVRMSRCPSAPATAAWRWKSRRHFSPSWTAARSA